MTDMENEFCEKVAEIFIKHNVTVNEAGRILNTVRTHLGSAVITKAVFFEGTEE